MDLMKRITTYFTILTFTLTGVPISSIASEGDEDAGSFDDPDTAEDTEDSSSGSKGSESGAGAGAGAGVGAGVWVAITGAILGLFSGGSSEFMTPSGNPPVIHSLKPNAA